MRTIIIIAALAAVAVCVSSCYVRISKETKEALREELKTRSELEEVVYDPTDSVQVDPGAFHSIQCQDALDVILVQCEGEPRVMISGIHRRRDYVKVENDEGKLVIRYDKPLAYGEKVTVFFPEIPDFSLWVNGSGDIRGEVPITIIGENIIRNNGSGDIDLSLRGSGNLSVILNGSGDITLDGEVDTLKISANGSGDLNAEYLGTKKVEIESDRGSGDLNLKDQSI